MNNIVKYIAGNDFLKRTLSQSSLARKIASGFIAGERLDEISSLIEGWNTTGFGTILYPIEANTEDYINSLRFLSEKRIIGSISLRIPLDGLSLIIAEAKRTGLRIEFDMRSPDMVDQTLQYYAKSKKEYDNSVVCLQANLYRTADDIKKIMHLSPIARLVKGAFKDKQAYSKRKDIDLSFIRLADLLMEGGIKTYFATHDEGLINKVLQSMKHKNIDKRQVGFQMLHGVRQDLQERLRSEGYEVWKYASYGEDWVPYSLNRLFERKENIRYILDILLRK